MAQGRTDQLFDVTSRQRSTSSARADKGMLGIVVCIGLALLQSPLVRAQDLVPTILPEPTIIPELSKRTAPEPMKVESTPTLVTEKPSIEISAGTPSEKPAPIAKQTPLPKTRAMPAAALEQNPRPAKLAIVEISAGTPSEKPAPIAKQVPPPKTGAMPAAALEQNPRPAKLAIVQPKAPEPTAAIVLTLSALKAVATTRPLPDYPYQAKQAHVTGSGICNLVVDSTNGRVTSATMAQSTGSQILDKATTDTFGRWRFKPGTVAQVKVPITYE